MYQAAHNALGRIITRAVAKGSMGGNIIQADVGSAAMCARDGVPDPGQRRLSASNIPLPPNAPPSQRQAHKELENMSIPDATLILPDPRPNHLQHGCPPLSLLHHHRLHHHPQHNHPSDGG